MTRTLFILALFCGSAHAQTVTSASYGMNFHSNTLTQKTFSGLCRLWNATDQLSDDVSWAVVETARGTYTWTALDAAVNACKARGQQILYTFGNVPAWANGGGTNCSPAGSQCNPPTNFSDLYNFVTAVVSRYNGDGIIYNVWNEVDLSTNWWSGTSAQMLTIAQQTYSIVHSIDPTALVSTPTYASSGGFYGSQQFLASGGGAYADIIDTHCYPFRAAFYSSTPPTTTPEAVWNAAHYYTTMTAFFGQSSKPLICNEGGWAQDSISALTSQQKIAYAAIWQILLLSGGEKTIAWYSYDDSLWGPLWDGSTWLNSAGLAYRITQSWLAGATFATPVSRIAGTNQIRNPSMSGAVAGTPGTAPTDMSIYNPDSAKGITTQIVGTGTEAGLAYVDFRVFGTATTGAAGFVQFSFEAGQQIAAALGQQWTAGVYAKLQATPTPLPQNSIVLEINENNSSGTYLDNILYDFFNPIGATLNLDQESFATHTLNSSVAYVVPVIAVTYSIGTAFDITLRLASPSMDTGSIWSGALTRPGGYTATIAWDAAGGPTSYATGQAYQRDLFAGSRPIAGGSVTLTNLPLLLESAQPKGWTP